MIQSRPSHVSNMVEVCMAASGSGQLVFSDDVMLIEDQDEYPISP